jgi:hypothetical protein
LVLYKKVVASWKKKIIILFYMLFAIVCLWELEIPRQWWLSPLLGRFKLLFFFSRLIVFKDFSVFVVGWHIPRRNLNTKER